MSMTEEENNRKSLARKAERRAFFSTAGLHVILTLLSLILFLPFIWMILTSLKPLVEIGTKDWLPKTPHWGNYLEVFKQIPFARFYWNSILIASSVTLLQVFTSSLAAYSFSRLHWPGRDKVFFLYLSTMMVPGLVMIIPNFQIMIQLSLVNTFLGLVLPASFNAYGTFLLRQFMLTIPTSLDEAAEIDGASKWQIFWDVIMPLSRPGLIALTIFSFIGQYHSFFWPLVMLKSVERYTLPIGLLYFDTTYIQSTHLLMAAVTMSVIPMIIVFILMQKHLVRGIQLGGVKG